MWFWIKHLLLTGILVAIAAYLLTYKGRVIDGQGLDGASKQNSRPFSSTSSDAAQGLSNFYAKFKARFLTRKDKEIEGFVISLAKPDSSVEQQLQNRAKVVKPGSYRFKGEFTARNFKTGGTIKNILTGYAAQEGIELMWRLEKDYVIKHYFQVESDFIEVLYSVSTALDSDFEQAVFAYYCPRERAAVVTHEVSDYVKNNCKQVRR